MKDKDIGYVYIAEETNSDNYKVTDVDVIDKPGAFFVRFKACLQSFGVMNRNGRCYVKENVMNNLQTERIQSMIKDGCFYGECDHPQAYIKDRPLSSERINTIDMHNTTHKMLNPHCEGNLLMSDIESDAGTDVGVGLAKKMAQGGYNPSFSCRAIAGIGMMNGRPTVDVKKIITYDLVLFPSHREASKVAGSEKFISKPAHVMTESCKGTLVPLTDIIDVAGNKCDNAKIVMEAFDLTPNNIVGVDRKKDLIIFKDQTNTIYCNMEESTKERINDIFNSFDLIYD